MTIIENPGVFDSSIPGIIPKHDRKTILEVSDKAAALLDIDEAIDFYWFHSTVQENWHENATESDVWVHIGLWETADVITENYAKYGLTPVVHKIVLNENIRIHPAIFEDHNVWPRGIGENVDDEEFSKYAKWDGFRYINSFETPGFISLLVKPSMFTVIETIPVDM